MVYAFPVITELATARDLQSGLFGNLRGGKVIGLLLGCFCLAMSCLGDVVSQAKRVFGLGELTLLGVAPEGNRLATGGQSGAFIWNLGTGEVVRRLDRHGAPVTALSFSPDGRFLATAARDGGVRVWSVETGELTRAIPAHRAEILSVSFSPDGGRLVSASADNTARVWSLATGEELFKAVSPGRFVNVAVFTRSGEQLVTADSSTKNGVAIWNLATGKQVRTFGDHDAQVSSLAVLTDNLVATGGDDGTIRLWDISTGERQSMFSGPKWSVSRLQVSGSQLFAAFGTGHLMAWDFETGALLLEMRDEAIHAMGLGAPASRLYTATVANRINIWDLELGAVTQTLNGHATSTLLGVAFSPDHRHVLSGGVESAVRLWNRTSGTLVRVYEGQSAGTSVASFSPDGTQVLTTMGFPRKAAVLWRTETGQRQQELLGHTDWLTGGAFSVDGTQVVTASLDRTAKLWDSATGTNLRTFQHTGPVTAVAISPDRKFIAGGGSSSDPTARVWDAASGNLVRSFSEEAGSVRGLAFSPTGNRLLVGWEGGLVRVFAVETGELLNEILPPTGFLNAATFSPDGRLILTGEGWPVNTARLWDATTGQELRVFAGHTSGVNSVAFSPQGTSILTGADTVRLWDIRDVAGRVRYRNVNGGLELSWKFGTLQMADAPNGPWSDAEAVGNPWTIHKDRVSGFFRVAIPASEIE